jgi:non-ribosomal peptide synthetase component F
LLHSAAHAAAHSCHLNAVPFLSFLPPQALLCRYSGQEEVVVGVPVAGRDRPETHPIIGYFINSVPILGGLGDTSGGDGEGPTLAAMARAASQALTDALAHSLLPLTQLAAAVRAERILGANPVFQVRTAGEGWALMLVLLFGVWLVWWVLVGWFGGCLFNGCWVFARCRSCWA